MTRMRTGLGKYIFVDPSPRARRLFWHVLGLGLKWVREPEPHPAGDKPGGVLEWLEAGSGWLAIGPHRFPFDCGPRFWLFSLRQPRLNDPRPGQVLGTQVIRFSGPTLDAWLEDLGTWKSPEFRFTPRAAAEIYATQRRLGRLVTQRPPLWEWEVHLILTRLFERFFLARKLLPAVSREPPAAVTRALNAIAADPFRDWRARELARCAGMDYTTFRIVFRTHLGESVHDYLQRARRRQAEVLLSDTRLRIKEVAQRLHFKNEHYFSHFFRLAAGMTPTQYRAHLGNRRPPRALVK
jgi:AraC-like DNA-binding protein